MAKKPIYYALWCTQTNQYMNTGLNCTTKRDVRYQLLSYLTDDGDDEDMKYLRKSSLQTLCDVFEFRLDFNDVKFPDEYEFNL